MKLLLVILFVVAFFVVRRVVAELRYHDDIAAPWHIKLRWALQDMMYNARDWLAGRLVRMGARLEKRSTYTRSRSWRP